MNDNKYIFIQNLEKLHITELGVGRIKKNLCLDVDDVVKQFIDKIVNSNAIIVRKGKNWYIDIDNFEITVNACSYTIITAHKINKQSGILIKD